MAAQDFTQDQSFLGRDFLTWLWFRCEVEGGEFQLPLGRGGRGAQGDPNGGATAVMVEDALSLMSVDEDGSVMTLRKGTPTARPEAASALAAGMTLKKARLFVARGPREWQFTLDGETLDIGSLKTPTEEEEVSPEDLAKAEANPDEGVDGSVKKAKKKGEEKDALDELADKLLAAEEAREVVDALFRQFLDVRLAKDWEKAELPRMLDWVGVKLERAAAEL